MPITVKHRYNTRLATKMNEPNTTNNNKKINKKTLESSDDSSDDSDYTDADTDADTDVDTDADADTDVDTDADADTDVDTNDNSADEDDLLSETEDDFIVKDNHNFNNKGFQELLCDLFPSKYIKNRLKKITPSKSKKGKSLDEKPLDIRNIFDPLNIIDPNHFNDIIESLNKNDSRNVHTPDKHSCYKVEDNDLPSNPGNMSKFNIIFTIKPKHLGKDKAIQDYEEYHSEEGSCEEGSCEEGSCEEGSCEESVDADADAIPSDNEDNMDIDIDDDVGNIGLVYICENTKAANESTLEETLANIKPQKKSQKILNGNKTTNKTSLSSLCKKRKYKNTLKFRTLLQQKNVMNDLNYFQEKMSLEEQNTVLKQMEEINSIIDIDKPYRLALLEANIPPRFKACAYNKLSTLKHMEPGCSEYNKIKHWVDDFMRIPFNKFKHLPVNIDDGIDKCHDFMEKAKNTLDKAVYGLNDVKLQVMQMVGQWITNPDAIGNSIAIEGPPGTGKTTLVKEGISKILNREFVFIPLGGATDSSSLEGHSYTYEGSNCGLIVKQLIQCQSMNPIIYFDELDKISDTPKGDEIVGILTHLTDTSQNSSFHDKYFAEFAFDLSRCVFFFSYNDRSKVNKILLDRMHCIMTKGYELPQKTIISTDYLLPVIRNQVRFKEGDIILPEDTLHHIINTHTQKEDGVRNLKRCLEIIHTKLNLYRLMKPDTNLFEQDMAIKVEFPITITPKIVDKLIKKDNDSGKWQNMYT